MPTLGAGELHFSLFKTGTKTPAGFRYLGNTPSFGLTINSETLAHYAVDRGAKEKDASPTIQTDRSGKLVTDEILPDNLALVLLGAASVQTQTSGTGLTETFTGIKQGLGYQLGLTTVNPSGVRSITITSVMVGASAKTLGTDYNVDTELGIVTPVVGGTIADAADMIVNYSRAAKSRQQIISSNNQVEGALRFIAYNPAGPKIDFYMPWVKLSPDGEFALKGDAWQEIGLNVDILKIGNGVEAIYADGRPY